MIKLIPQQISEQWDSIRAGLLITLPPITQPTPEALRAILTQLLCEHIQCWAILDSDKRIQGHALTTISLDIHSQVKTLVIYSLYLTEQVTRETWENGFKVLNEFAQKEGCFRIAAYTRNQLVMSISAKFGFSSEYTYLTKDV